MKFDSEAGFEVVSALADGQLRGKEFAQTVERLNGDSNARSAWHTYHVVGDVLRATELSDRVLDDAGFVSRFQARLARESAAGALALPLATSDFSINHLPALETSKYVNQASANESGFKWKVLAGCASMAAVAAIGWSALLSFDNLDSASKSPQMASSPAPGVVPGSTNVTQMGGSLAAVTQPIAVTGATANGVMIRDPNLDALLAAHRQFGGSSALQMPTGFLRNATFEGAGRQ